jgi:hypothetical protein
MGLAASQARLLLLTARQSDVESQLMNIANQKLSLSRRTAEISTQYREALNEKILTWDTPDGTVNLNYGLLMRPNIVADKGQYILTNSSTGKIILNDGYINDLGIAQAGNPGDIANVSFTYEGVTYTGMKAFLMRLIGCDPDSADRYIDAGNRTNSNSIFETNYSDSDIIANSIGLGAYTAVTTLGHDEGKSSWWGLSGDSSSSVDTNAVIQNFDNMLQSYSTSIGSELKSYLTDYLGTAYGRFIDDGLDYAYQATFNKFVYNVNDADSEDGVQLGTSPSFTGGNADGKNSIAQEVNKDSGFSGFSSSSETTVTVDNSQIADTFLSYFDQYSAQHFGGESLATVGANSTVRGEHGGTGEQTDNNMLRSEYMPEYGDYDVNDNEVNDAYEGSFYFNLYNALLKSGWQTNSNVDDENYLYDQILYGNIAIKEMNGDGTWSNLSSSDPESPLGSKRDEEAIQKATADYDLAKSEISSLEASLNVKMENLDSERSAITTEVDSVKSILKKNIEGSFKIFTA